MPVGTGRRPLYPDLVLSSLERGHRLQAVVEVETGESVNHLEALAEWAHFAKLRAPFHLYVPSAMVDVARRLCEDNQIVVNEIWSFHRVGDDVRFTLVHRSREVPQPAVRRPAAQRSRRRLRSAPPKTAAPVKRTARPAAKPVAAPQGVAEGRRRSPRAPQKRK